MSTILYLRCFNHALREAVARCPQCSRTYCRECITEHESRVICARCLAALAQKGKSKRRARMTALFRGTWYLLSLLLLWGLFYYLGKALLHLPSSFHESFLGRSF